MIRPLIAFFRCSPGIADCRCVRCTTTSSHRVCCLPFSTLKPFAVPAPDGKLVLRTNGQETAHSAANESELKYYIESDGKRLAPGIRMYNSPYAMWSPFV